MSGLAAAPVLTPLAVAALCLLSWGSRDLQRRLSLLGGLTLLGLGLLLTTRTATGDVLVVALGGWPAPFGIVFVADALSSLLVTLAGLMGTLAVWHAGSTVPEDVADRGFYPLTQILLAGVCGAFLTGDLFNLYVWFEVLLVSSFVLLALPRNVQALEGSVKYVVLSLVGSLVFLTALGLTYATAGTLNMAQLATVTPGLSTSTVLPTAFLLILAFGLKAGVFPLSFWLPAAYPASLPAATVLFAGLLTKVGVYSLLRVVSVVLPANLPGVGSLLVVLAAGSMLVGVLGAVAQDELARLLAFHSVSQVGYMVMALAVATPLALAAGLVFVVHHSVVKSGLFLVSGLTERLRGSARLGSLGGLARTNPMLASAFLVLALSLAGIPPLSGFWAKLGVIVAAVQDGAWLLVVAALVAGLLTLLSMAKVWSKAFWGRADEAGEPGRARPIVPTLVLAGLAVVLGIAVEPLFELARTAGTQLVDPTDYTQAVLGGRG